MGNPYIKLPLNFNYKYIALNHVSNFRLLQILNDGLPRLTKKKCLLEKVEMKKARLQAFAIAKKRGLI